MKIVALFAALLAERLFTQLFHWRELRWLDPLFDFGLRCSARLSGVSGYAWILLVLVLAAAPVIALRLMLGDALLGLPYFLLSVGVLFLCLGPEDIAENVDHWCQAVRSGDVEEERVHAKALLERRFHDTTAARADVPAAVFVQANNRMFAVIFWFVVLGPVGAWVFRVADLARRRALFQTGREHPEATVASDCERRADDVHAWLAWIPARLTALGYVLAGNYDAGTDAWRSITTHDLSPSAANEALLCRVGDAATPISQADGESDVDWYVRDALASKDLVVRTLWFWVVGVAVLTLFGVLI
ncbi:MAG: regulatory signaling modulator protein AmpE [Pseudomonadota bacterium]